MPALLSDTDFDEEPVELPAAVNMKSGPLAAILRQVTDELLTPQFGGALQIHCLMTSAAIHLQRALLPPRIETPEQGKLCAAQVKALRDLVECSDAGLTLGEMARVCGVNPRRLSVLYRNTAGHTLRSYVAAAKIQRAHTLLSQETPIKQIAHVCGFQSVTAFTAAFRKATGTTPSRFRH
jgi:AraC family transcriptional regulator